MDFRDQLLQPARFLVANLTHGHYVPLICVSDVALCHIHSQIARDIDGTFSSIARYLDIGPSYPLLFVLLNIIL